jgi:hypothetical protein
MPFDPRTSYDLNHTLDLSNFSPAKSMKTKELTSPIKGIGEEQYETSAKADFKIPEQDVEKIMIPKRERILELSSGPTHFKTMKNMHDDAAFGK